MRIDRETILFHGMTAWPTSRDIVVVDLDPEADPIGLPPAVIDQEKRRLGSVLNDDGTWRLSWKYRKEYLRDFDAQTGVPVFEPEWIDAQKPNLRNPLYCIDLDESGRLVRRERGRVRVYAEPSSQPGSEQQLPAGAVRVTRAVGIGCDVGLGTGSSDTTFVGMFVDNREQCVEFNSNRITPNDFGRLVVAVAIYFNNALVCCVRKMHGLTVIRTMRDELNYAYLWHSRIESGMVTRPTDQLGWGGGEMTDERLVDPLRDALDKRNMIIRSTLLARQLSEYIFDDQGRIIHQSLAHESEAVREQHGDVVAGGALSLKACCDLPKFRAVHQRELTPMQKALQAEANKKKSVWS